MQVPKSHDMGHFATERGSKTHFAKSDPTSFGMLKPLVFSHCQLSLSHFPPHWAFIYWNIRCPVPTNSVPTLSLDWRGPLVRQTVVENNF